MKNKKNTLIQEIQKFIKTEVDLSFMTQEKADRLNYYLNDYFVSKEKEIITQAFNDGFSYEGLSFLTGEKYYEETFFKEK